MMGNLLINDFKWFFYLGKKKHLKYACPPFSCLKDFWNNFTLKIFQWLHQNAVITESVINCLRLYCMQLRLMASDWKTSLWLTNIIKSIMQNCSRWIFMIIIMFRFASIIWLILSFCWNDKFLGLCISFGIFIH